jgi:dipeptidase E
MRLLLTSAGISNSSIHDALVDLLGKPVADCSALCIPTAAYALAGGPVMASKLIRGIALSPLCELGWKSLGVLELTALPSIKEEYWVPMVQETDALLVGGGDPHYLCYWMQQSGLATLFPSLLRKTVYVGVSGGSMVMTAFGTSHDGHNLPPDSDRALGLVDFALFAHLDHERFPEYSLANLEKLAATIPVPMYALDDQTAIKVTDGNVEVVSEGHWKLFTR